MSRKQDTLADPDRLSPNQRAYLQATANLVYRRKEESAGEKRTAQSLVERGLMVWADFAGWRVTVKGARVLCRGREFAVEHTDEELQRVRRKSGGSPRMALEEWASLALCLVGDPEENGEWIDGVVRAAASLDVGDVGVPLNEQCECGKWHASSPFVLRRVK